MRWTVGYSPLLIFSHRGETYHVDLPNTELYRRLEERDFDFSK